MSSHHHSSILADVGAPPALTQPREIYSALSARGVRVRAATRPGNAATTVAKVTFAVTWRRLGRLVVTTELDRVKRHG